jgi:anti-sigma B factor antagonist
MITVFNEDEKNLLLNLDLQEADLNNADKFKAELLQLFETHQKRIVLNMQKVDYIDSSFLGALVAVLRHLISVKQDIILVALRKDIADLFALVRLDKVFKTYSSFDEAVAN